VDYKTVNQACSVDCCMTLLFYKIFKRIEAIRTSAYDNSCCVIRTCQSYSPSFYNCKSVMDQSSASKKPTQCSVVTC